MMLFLKNRCQVTLKMYLKSSFSNSPTFLTMISPLLFRKTLMVDKCLGKRRRTILLPLTSNEFSVHNPFSFAEEVSSFCPGYFMASLDVESLFTNIPLNEVMMRY